MLSLASSATAAEAPSITRPTKATEASKPTRPTGDSATTTAVEASALAIVNTALLKPLRERDGKQERMSRAAPRPRQRRARMTSSAPVLDSKGLAFLTFALDQQHGFASADDAWQRDVDVGCIYVDSGAVYVQRGEHFAEASTLLGKKPRRVDDHVCIEGATQAATTTTTSQAQTTAG